jgi:hypothetical protein
MSPPTARPPSAVRPPQRFSWGRATDCVTDVDPVPTSPAEFVNRHAGSARPGGAAGVGMEEWSGKQPTKETSRDSHPQRRHPAPDARR